MCKIGKRLIYNKENGKILNYCLEQMEGNIIEGLRPNEIDFIDLPFNYNENNFNEAIIYKIDITKDKFKTPLEDLIIITEYKQHIETKEEKLEKELLDTKAELVDLKYKEILNKKEEKVGR